MLVLVLVKVKGQDTGGEMLGDRQCGMKVK